MIQGKYQDEDKLTEVVVFENDEDLLFSLSFFQFPCI